MRIYNKVCEGFADSTGIRLSRRGSDKKFETDLAFYENIFTAVSVFYVARHRAGCKCITGHNFRCRSAKKIIAKIDNSRSLDGIILVWGKDSL